MARSEPTNFFPAVNAGVAQVLRNRLVVRSGNARGFVGATLGTQLPFGVTREDIAVGGHASIQVAGVADVTAGAAFNRGVQLTTDGQGRAVAAAAADEVWGISEQAAGAAGDVIEMLIQPKGLVV